jgi:hypothetical protein
MSFWHMCLEKNPTEENRYFSVPRAKAICLWRLLIFVPNLRFNIEKNVKVDLR